MKISMIAAMATDRAIGKDNQLLWRLPADLQFFKKITMDKPIIMGRKTFESIGRPLPGRKNIVLSTGSEAPHPDVILAKDIETALKEAGQVAEVMIIGGGKIYEAFLPQADQLFITYVDTEVEADTYFPEFDLTQWQAVAETEGKIDEKNQLAHRFVTYIKNN